MARTEGHWLDRGTYLEPDDPLGYDILIKGLNKYLNFNSISGFSGYGFRDNNGVLEYKNNGGGWTPIGSGGGGGSQNLQQVTDIGATTTNSITALSFIKSGGTSSQFLKADGSVDSNTYLTSIGTGTTNTITYWSGTNTIGSLSTATYPSLTELSYVKGVTSAIQTQLNNKANTSALSSYWKNDGTSSASGNWNLGAYSITAGTDYQGIIGGYNDGNYYAGWFHADFNQIAVKGICGDVYGTLGFQGSYGVYGYSGATGIAGFFQDSIGNIASLTNNTSAGYFEDVSGNTATLGDGTYALNANGNVNVSSNITCNTFQSTYFGYFGGSHIAQLGEDGVHAGYFDDGTRSVYVCDGTNAITATGNVDVTGDIIASADVYSNGERVLYPTSTDVVTNKRNQPRVSSETSSATPTIDTDSTDIHRITALTVDITSFTTNLSGTPVHGESLIIEITGTASRAITWGASFEASTVALPTTTSGTAMLTVGFKYNSATSKWRCLAVA